MNIKYILRSERCQTQMAKFCIIKLPVNLEMQNCMDGKKRISGCQVLVEGVIAYYKGVTLRICSVMKLFCNVLKW